MSNVKTPMTNEIPIPKNKKNYDLEERTARFGEDIIEFLKGLPKDEINSPLITQLVRAGTSIGANYMEADGAGSKRDFKYKISLVRKEAKETKHWLRMIAKANPDKKDSLRRLWQEAQELVLIFSSVLKSAQNNVKY
jgi:four helix bundle protein